MFLSTSSATLPKNHTHDKKSYNFSFRRVVSGVWPPNALRRTTTRWPGLDGQIISRSKASEMHRIAQFAVLLRIPQSERTMYFDTVVRLLYFKFPNTRKKGGLIKGMAGRPGKPAAPSCHTSCGFCR